MVWLDMYFGAILWTFFVLPFNYEIEIQFEMKILSIEKVYIGRGSLVVQVTVSRPACHEFEPSTAEDPPYRKGRCTLNMSRLKRPPVGMVKERGLLAEMTSPSLDYDSNLRGPLQKALE
ncbi:hypothetical protein TNCV_4954251 [Trichonephila clavipes]|nr:hypothetical protein TNCV_4954251 [Trichonephila clavipes]